MIRRIITLHSWPRAIAHIDADAFYKINVSASTASAKCFAMGIIAPVRHEGADEYIVKITKKGGGMFIERCVEAPPLSLWCCGAETAGSSPAYEASAEAK